MRFGVNMFGLNPIFLQDKEAFLKRMKKAGFRYMEPVLALEPIEPIRQNIWLREDFKENKDLLDQYGVSICSAHVFTRDIAKDAAEIIAQLKPYGVKQVILPCPSFPQKEDYEKAAAPVIEAGKLFGAAGMELLLHNGKDESLQQFDGISAYEWFLNRCCESVRAQADVGWLLYGGTDPEAFLWRNCNLVRSLHYKDMEETADANGNPVLTETGIGHGLVDMTACFQFARANEIIQLMDQDGSKGDFLEDVDFVGNLLNRLTGVRDNSTSILCVMDTKTNEVTELKQFDRIIEAPNWYQQDDDLLYYNSEGHIWKYRISTGQEEMLESGLCDNCNNDHVISAKGDEIAVSNFGVGFDSKIYIFPIEGGEPRLVTKGSPSFLHGWSPDTKELCYCAFREGEDGFAVDVYSISSQGGEERQLTKNAGFNDGPEYSPDGEYIWFISTRSGLMQNFCMKKDGSEQTQMTHSDRNNWFGHISPDGKKVVYLSYSREGLDPNEHLPNMNVELSLMNFDGSDDHTILRFFGGQGSINVNSWNPDSRRFAFVKYELNHK